MQPTLRPISSFVAPDNSGRELGNSLASLSVSIQAARAKSVTTARDLLSVDALPPQPYINGILPIVPPPAWLAPDVHPRRFAVMPFPERPPPIPEPMAYQIPWIPPITYQPSQVNIPHDYQSYGVVETIPNHSDPSLDSHHLQSLDSHYLQNLDSHHRHYPRLNTAVTPVFSPPRQPPSSRSASSFAAVPSTRASVNGRNTMVIQQPPRRTIAASVTSIRSRCLIEVVC